jgi:hypothetical protein
MSTEYITTPFNTATIWTRMPIIHTTVKHAKNVPLLIPVMPDKPLSTAWPRILETHMPLQF